MTFETKDYIALWAFVLGVVNLGWNVYVYRRVQAIGRNIEEYKAKVQIKLKRVELLREAAVEIGSIRMDQSLIEFYNHPDTRGGYPEGYRQMIPSLYLSNQVMDAVRRSKIEFSAYEKGQLDEFYTRLRENEYIRTPDGNDPLPETFMSRVLDYEAREHELIDQIASFLRDMANRIEASIHGETDV